MECYSRGEDPDPRSRGKAAKYIARCLIILILRAWLLEGGLIFDENGREFPSLTRHSPLCWCFIVSFLTVDPFHRALMLNWPILSLLGGGCLFVAAFFCPAVKDIEILPCIDDSQSALANSLRSCHPSPPPNPPPLTRSLSSSANSSHTELAYSYYSFSPCVSSLLLSCLFMPAIGYKQCLIPLFARVNMHPSLTLNFCS
jgi:hypothetical protein